MSKNILSAAKYDEKLHVRVADVTDLVAAEGIYHANCMKKLFRDVEKAKSENKSIIQAPAHELSTLNTVVKRVIHVAEALNQTKVVLTVDQSLFPGLMELKCVIPEY